ncbi:uncharacterized protein LOC133194798 isoform X2 [Saccostrea echinata]|uniref:uncharacterized protein LOC133194798 isoform X2 n=1 Tax=Saccostrea echinata TaxID=191078 RepID=UPI002A7F6A65|nr:uncharacterized protein LOC133194798 isoform X2 [Saccostrea echinata]
MNLLTKCRIVPSCGGLLLLPVVFYLIMVLLFRDSRNTVTVIQEQSCDIEMLSVLKEREMALYQKYYGDIQAIGGGDWTFKSTRQCLNINSEFYKRSIDGRKQLIPMCNSSNVSINAVTNFNQSLPVFEFPNRCINLIIFKFCSGEGVVPNIIHYIWFGIQNFELIHFVSFYSAYKKQKPCLILLFSDFLPFGDLWDLLLTVIPNIIHIRVSAPLYISGRRISWVQHKSDIVRLLILKEYGGIYCDTDQIILRSLNVFRNNECTMGNAHDGSLGSALILAAKNSQFINKWIESYISYDPAKWGDNSVTMAMKLAKENKDLIQVQDHHCVFFPHAMILYNQNYKWSHSYGLHVYKLGHIEELKRLNFTNIRRLNSTIGAVFRYILYGDKEMCE